MPKKKLTKKEKWEKVLRALRCYANMDMWHWGEGIPKRHGESYGKGYGDGIKYNAFGIAPDQDGWELAESTLIEIGEK